ncbi:hypothetical protein DPMN_098362 [Dreissena polymorpha]|uniref:Uncharacterized protein n=1 Tax=Dreissena polymorpha TaxID=45954 RepID=A0A9D4R689_DREPO|nr:hypothetical protein DPMN_098362 [Dreissena polymorpha]
MDQYLLHSQTLNNNTKSPSIKTRTMKGLRLTEDGSVLATVQPTRHKHNPLLRHGQIITTRRTNRVFTRRIALALGIDPRNDAESVLTSRTFAE